MSDRPRRPWWTYAVPWVGRVPELSAAQWRMLGLLGAAELFDNYDVGIMGLALPQIQKGLGIAEPDVGPLYGVVRMGVVLSLGAAFLADRLGRRRLLLGTILGFTLTTFGTAFAPTPLVFGVLQFLARGFIYAETALAAVVVAEELAARDRGWGIGMLGAIGALGHGLSAIAFGFVDVLPFGWRALYAIGAIPLLMLAWLRRGLPETRRFEAQRGLRQSGGFIAPLRSLLRMYPGRLAALLAAVGSFEFALAPATIFMPKTLQEVHGYAPEQVTFLYLAGGVLGILGNIAAGSLSDRIGRRLVLVALTVAGGLAFVGFYNLRGWIIVPCWILQVFALQGVGVLFKAIGGEAFPTSYRGTAAGIRAAVGTAAGSLSLVLEGPLYTALGSHAAAISSLLPMLVIPAALVWLALPETATRELEEVSPER